MPRVGCDTAGEHRHGLGIERGVVLLEVELEGRGGRDVDAVEEFGQVLEQEDVLVDGPAAVVPQGQFPQIRRRERRHRAGAGGGVVDRAVVQDGETALGVDHQIDLDTRAEPHALDDPGRGERRVVGAPPAPVPLEHRPMAVVVDVDRGGGVRGRRGGHSSRL